jgi:hypothetical protein
MTSLSSDILSQMEQAAQSAMSPHRDRAAMKQACEEMERISEEIRKQHGILDLGVQAIRELRDEE